VVTTSHRIISSITNDTCEAIEDFDEVEKLAQGFSSADTLEEMELPQGRHL
jgi:hypothetical protein